MAFDSIKGLFSKTEKAPQPADIIGSLSQEHRNTLNVLRDALQTKGNLTGEQIGALSFVRDAMRESLGEAAMEEAIKKYFKEKPASRLSELQEVLSRNSFLQSTLMKSMADVDKSATSETIAALDRAKNALRVLSSETFTSKDIDALCAELKESDEYIEFLTQRIAAEATSVAVPTEQQYVPGVTPTLPKQTPHSKIGEPNLKWTPHTADDTLHNAPPTHLKK
jgi:mRNA-degrading endonuclease HigB of HigAB toxin-antitoxin module